MGIRARNYIRRPTMIFQKVLDSFLSRFLWYRKSFKYSVWLEVRSLFRGTGGSTGALYLMVTPDGGPKRWVRANENYTRQVGFSKLDRIEVGGQTIYDNEVNLYFKVNEELDRMKRKKKLDSILSIKNPPKDVKHQIYKYRLH